MAVFGARTLKLSGIINIIYSLDALPVPKPTASKYLKLTAVYHHIKLT